MSLVGNLADLGLGEIFQIVALSQKSGTLQLSTQADSANIFFLNGKVIGAVRDAERLTVAEVMLSARVLNPLELQEMLRAQKDGGTQSQPPLLWQRFGSNEEKVEAALRSQVERLIFTMFDWEDGTFGFVIAEDTSALGHLDLASNRFTVMNGLNAQFLAMEGLRLRDEARHNDPLGEFLQSQQKQPAEGEPPPDRVDEEQHQHARERLVQVMAEPAAPLIANLVVIDEDQKLLRQFEARFSGPFTVHTYGKVDTGLKGVRELLWAQKPVVVITDLIIARSDGSGILGGVEVLEKLRPDYPDLPVILISAYPNADARARAEQLHATGFVIKVPDKMPAFFAEVEAALGPMTEKTEKITPLRSQYSIEPHELDEQGNSLTDLGRELMSGVETGLSFAPDDGVSPTGELGTLKSLLIELVNPSNKETVTLLVLRYAAELFARGVLLLVTREEILGLGGFAAGMPNDQFVRLVRTVRVPIRDSRALGDVVRSREVRRKALGASEAERALAQRVGIDPEGPIFMAPLVSNDRVPAILLGDNQQLGKDLGDTQGLEIFLLQAGLAMERTLLERRLKELSNGGDKGGGQ